MLFGTLATISGVLLCYFFPDPWRREPKYTFSAPLGMFAGILFSGIVGKITHSPFAVIPVGLFAGYFAASLPNIEKAHQREDELKGLETPLRDRVLFSHSWDARPRYEREEEGLFVGRGELLERLTSDFISKRSGTILISGVRGVGKTALVERALVEARNKLQNRYWKKALKFLDNPTIWRPIDARVRGVLIKIASERLPPPIDYLALKSAADAYAARPARWFWKRLNPIDWRIRRMRDASRSQLFVLKFNASDIGGALAEPGENATSGKPQVNPEKLLRALIRKLYMTCHSSRPKEEAGRPTEAGILQWSLRDKKQRQQFFDTLANAYNKSVSKSYKEIISNSVNEAIKQSQSAVSEGKFSVEKLIILAVFVVIGVGAALAGWTRAWRPLESYIASGAATAVAAYLSLAWTFKRSRESSSDRARQAQFSYEYDYSLAQLEYDLRDIVRALHPRDDGGFDPLQCFSRSIIIFDELDKLEDPVRQLNDVITHFKNFFTLSEALFLFLTDHGFYEHLSLESAKAQLKRVYSQEHTFFTQKIYLRKPEFSHFNETFYRFCDFKDLEQRAQTAEPDADVINYLLQQKDELFTTIEQWPAETLTHLFLHRRQYADEQKEAIERAFTNRGGWSNPLALAQIWCGLVAVGTDGEELKMTVDAFTEMKGWDNPQAVAFLYHRRSLFGEDDCESIERHYRRLKSPSLERYTSVDAAPFTLSDLARALCFRTRNHYFDLYYLVYDYVGSYADGAPVLHVEDERFNREQRLWSRYQQLVEAAFYHRRENHPSREYFNSLLMDSLYAVFDSRATGSSVKISDIMFSSKKLFRQEQPVKPSPAPVNPWLTGAAVLTVTPDRAATSTTVSPPSGSTSSSNGDSSYLVNHRDVEQINQAILRLLRLALARKAISVSAELSAKLKEDNLTLEAIATEEFTWNPDCEPLITQEGIDLEQYEKDLIKFWDDSRVELEALNNELEKLSAYASLLEESAIVKMRSMISKLRTISEGLRRRSITTSRPDATGLKANIGSAETLVARVLGFILERIRAEGDAETSLASELMDGTHEVHFQSILNSRQPEVEAISKLPLRAVVWPRESKCLMYLLAGPIPADLDVKALEQILPKQDAYIFWYAPGREPSELSDFPKALRFYFPPPAANSLASLFTDYVRLARRARVQELVVSSRGKEHKDKGLAMQVGAELVGPINPANEIILLMSNPAVGLAAESLSDLPKLSRTLGLDAEKAWSLDAFIKALAHHVLERISDKQQLPFDLEVIVGGAIGQLLGPDASKLTAASFASTTVFSDQNKNVRAILQSVLSNVLVRLLTSAGVGDAAFQALVTKEFVARLSTLR